MESGQVHLRNSAGYGLMNFLTIIIKGPINYKYFLFNQLLHLSPEIKATFKIMDGINNTIYTHQTNNCIGSLFMPFILTLGILAES